MKSAINRSVLRLRPKEAYLNWARNLEEGHDIEDVNKETFCNAYLIKEIITPERNEIRKVLAKYWREIAEEEFEAWWAVEEDWPKLKTIKDFEEYFDWEYIELVFDLENSRIAKESEADYV